MAAHSHLRRESAWYSGGGLCFAFFGRAWGWVRGVAVEVLGKFSEEFHSGYAWGAMKRRRRYRNRWRRRAYTLAGGFLVFLLLEFYVMPKFTLAGL
jgi:hypothetical protein